MQLSPGMRLAHDEITVAIGRGGIVEVFRAKDTRLGRDVAIKLIPDDCARAADELRVVAEGHSPRRQPDKASFVFERLGEDGSFDLWRHWLDFDVTPDGKGFTVTRDVPDEGNRAVVTLVTNWYEEFRK